MPHAGPSPDTRTGHSACGPLWPHVQETLTLWERTHPMWLGEFRAPWAVVKHIKRGAKHLGTSKDV